MAATVTYSFDIAGLNEFCASRARTLGLVDGLIQAQLDHAPASDRWFIGEVLDHMLLAERINREQIAKLIEMKREGRRPELSLTFSDLNISVAGVPRSILKLLETPLTMMNMLVPDGLRNYLTRKRVIPFRNPDSATPCRGRPAIELRGDLKASLHQTVMLFQNHADLEYSDLTLRHPLLGRYHVPGLLLFMAAHEQRHQSQIGEIQTDPGFPSSTG